MSQKRTLGMVETYVKFCSDYANGTTSVVAMIGVSGPLKVEIMKGSLDLLQKRHPLLRAFISRSHDGQDFLEVDAEAWECPLEVIERDHPDQWQEIYERHLNQAFDTGKGYLWRATLLSNENGKSSEHELVLSFHHTVIDGLSIGSLFKDLLDYYRLIAGGDTPKVEPLPFFPSVDALLRTKMSWSEHLERSEIVFAHLSNMVNHLFSYEQNAPLYQRKTRVIYYESDEEQLASMIRLSKHNSTTLTSLLSAALMIAAQRVKSEENNGVVNQQLATTPVNLRNHCNPMVEAEHIGCFVSAVTTMHLIDEETPLWDLARSFTADIRNAFKEQVYATEDFNRQEYIGMLASLDKGPLAEKYHLGVGVTNYGVLDIPVDSGPLHLQSFYSGATRHWGDWLMLLHTASVGGKLYHCFCYEEPLLSRESADSIVTEFISLLHSAMETG